ncbi:MAG TPA: helix-turn-helix domain-containing protein, partial [Nakamurella sp.]
LTALDQALLDRDRPCIGAVSDGHTVVLLPAEPAALADDLIGAVTRLDSALVVHGGRATAAGQDGFADSAGLAITAARVAALRGVPLVDGESIAGQVLIAAPAVRSAFLGLAEQRLRPLAQYDLTNDSDLIGTLRAFLEHNGHWEAASTALGIHRHTLHNRVDRIEAMLGVDLESAHVRAELLLCLLTWR